MSDVTSAALSSKADRKNRNKTATMTSSSVTSSTRCAAEAAAAEPVKVLLAFKRNIFDPRKLMLQ